MILSRRHFLGCACCAGAALALPPQAPAAGGPRTSLTPDQALAALKEGNDKFITDAPFRGVQGRERRIEIARGQAPIAVLVSCSDSRVPPELLFGRGLGELFIVRNAGNTVDTTALGSIQYAVAELGVPLVLVLGHERCGAVDAAVKVVKDNATFPGSHRPDDRADPAGRDQGAGAAGRSARQRGARERAAGGQPAALGQRAAPARAAAGRESSRSSAPATISRTATSTSSTRSERWREDPSRRL